MELTPHTHLVPKVLEKSIAIPLLTLRACVAYKKGEKPIYIYGDRGSTVVKMLCYKSEGRWFDSRWCHWNFSLTQSLTEMSTRSISWGQKAAGA